MARPLPGPANQHLLSAAPRLGLSKRLAPSAVAAARLSAPAAEPASAPSPADPAARKRKRSPSSDHADSAGLHAPAPRHTMLPFSFRIAADAANSGAPPGLTVSPGALAAVAACASRSAPQSTLPPPAPAPELFNSALGEDPIKEELGGSQNVDDMLVEAKEDVGGSQAFDELAAAVARKPVLRSRPSTRQTTQFLAGLGAGADADPDNSRARGRARALLEAVAGGELLEAQDEGDWCDGGELDGDLDGDDIFAVLDRNLGGGGDDEEAADQADWGSDGDGAANDDDDNDDDDDDVASVQEDTADSNGASPRIDFARHQVPSIPFDLLDLPSALGGLRASAAPTPASALLAAPGTNFPGFCLASLLSQVHQAPAPASAPASTSHPTRPSPTTGVQRHVSRVEALVLAPSATVRVQSRDALAAPDTISSGPGVRLQFTFH